MKEEDWLNNLLEEDLFKVFSMTQCASAPVALVQSGGALGLCCCPDRTCGLGLNPFAPLRLSARLPKRCDSRAGKMHKDKNLQGLFFFKHLSHSHWIPVQAVASELSQLSLKAALGSLRHRTKLPNTSLNHEKLLLLFLSQGCPCPVCLTVWSVPLSVPPQLLEKGRIFYLKHSLDYASTERHSHQPRWHFWWCCFDQHLCVSEECSLKK